MNDVEEIKRRLDLVELVSAYLPLLKAGGANMKARCPFHQEKTPSFYVSRDRQMWHCFGCGEGGDAFSFVMKMEGIDFRDALKLLADKAGVPLADWKPEQASERRRLLDALSLAQRFYAAMLRDAPQAEKARSYVAKRGVTPETQQAFGLGYALADWDALARTLAKRGIAPIDLEKAGLVVRREKGSGHYDRFRDRLMFPIRDAHGQVVGFTARLLDPEAKEAKYVNTPQTAVYDKSATLYGIDRARSAIRETDLAVVVEGNMDVIACHQAGMANVVAASGTALTADQLRLLSRYTRNLAIAFDADSAGEKAAARGIDLAVGDGFSVRVIRIPEGAGKDPDDVVRKDPAIWKKAVADAVPVMRFHFDRLTVGRDLADPQVKKQVGNALLAEIGKLPDAIEQSHWLQRLASLLLVPEQVLRESLMKRPGARSEERGEKSAGVSPGSAPLAPRAISRHRLLSESYLALLFGRPDLVAAAVVALPAEALSDPELEALYRAAVAGYTQNGQFAVDAPEPGPDGLLRSLILRGERDFASLARKTAETELATLTDALRDMSRGRRLAALQSEMAAAELGHDATAVADLEKQVQELLIGRS